MKTKRNKSLLCHLCLDFVWELNTFNIYFKAAILKEKELEAEVVNERELIINKLENPDMFEDDDYEEDEGYSVKEKKDVWLKAVENVIGHSAYPPYIHVPFIVGGFCIVMFHSFERFLENIFIKYINEDIDRLFDSHINKKSLAKFLNKKKKPDYLCDWKVIYPQITKLPSFNKLEELNLVCNVFKHGKGDSYNKLRFIRPDLFKFHKPESGYLRPSKGWDMNLTEKDFDEYFFAVKSFLKEAFPQKNLLE